MKKILITGSNGFLGSNLVDFFSESAGYQVFSTSRSDTVDQNRSAYFQGDLLDKVFVDRLFKEMKPDIVINTVSLVNVDQCDEKPEFAHRITVNTAENIAKACAKNKARLLYISTDHLFDGKNAPYTEKEIPHPVNEYGRSKNEAEKITQRYVPDSVIIRTNFFGISPKGHSITFGEWVYNNLRQQNPMTLFVDYYFSPIEVHYLAEAIETIIRSEFSGIINVAGSQRCSKYEFGIELARICGFGSDAIIASRITPDSFKAPRQPDLSLSTKKYEHIFHRKLPSLEKSLRRFCKICKNGCNK
jgi:dTDP-4-dehydrorhamnose reductase